MNQANNEHITHYADTVAELLVQGGYYINARKLKSSAIKVSRGAMIPAYVCCRSITSNVKDRELLEAMLADDYKKNFTEDASIIGLVTGGISWAHAVASKLRKPMLFVRKTEKDGGLGGLVEGDLRFAPKKAVLLDDVLGNGDTADKAQNALAEKGIEVIGIECIASLRDKAVNHFEDQGIKVRSLTGWRNILNAVKKTDILNEEEFAQMKAWHEERTLL